MEQEFLTRVTERYAPQPLFRQAVSEFLEHILPYLSAIQANEIDYARLERMLMPERIISFKVVWEGDDGKLNANTGWRVQFNSALGPYKGGLRFDPSVSEDVLKFLGFEQIFKNALTGLPLGGGKGGSDFDPKGKSDSEIRRFCVAFISELAKYIGPDTDVPAGDMGVGSREIGYMYGAYKKLTNKTDGTLTGKGVGYGGSYIRTEATGYGAVYFIKEMLAHREKEITGMRVVISGSGNVATHVAEKLVDEGALPLTLSDREGYIYAETGLTREVINAVKILKEKKGSLKELKGNDFVYCEGTPWASSKADMYIPAATQNEIDETDAKAIIQNGAFLVAEAANMPVTLNAIKSFEEADILFGPAKAVNAGGVAVSGLEMSQNAAHIQWKPEEVDARLRDIMKHIHETCVQYGNVEGKIDYVKGANVGGFIRVFSAMKSLGF